MAQPYNLTAISQCNGLFCLGTEANLLVNGLLGTLLLISTFIILLVAFKRFEMKISVSAACYLNSIIAILLRVMGWIGDVPMFTMFIITVIALVWIRWDS